jgi:drug/metabolite transporter (DMT)-like permease
MGSTVLGALAAIAASALFSIGLVLQATEARKVDSRYSLHLSLIAQLMSRWRWVVGTLVTLAGFPLHVLALLLAPLTVVQPALATGLLLLLAIGVSTPGENVRRRDVVGVTAIVGGVVALTLGAPDRASLETQAAPVLVALAALAAVTLLPYALTRLRPAGGPSLATMATFAAGAAYAFSGITTKLLADGLAGDELAAALGWLVATAVVGGLGFLGQLTALQRRSATQVGPVIYVVPVLAPVLLAPFLTGEQWGATPLGGGLLVAGLLGVCAGTAFVSASPSVSRVTEGRV